MLDGAVLVSSAVEVVQAQTRVLLRVLRRLGIPTVLYVNKIDHMGARAASLLDEVAERLTPRVVAMGEVTRVGTSSAAYPPYAADGACRERLAETLAEVDLLADWVERPATVTTERLLGCRAELTARARVHPVFLGSAVTGAGVAELTDGLTRLLPARRADADGPVAGTVIKIDRAPRVKGRARPCSLGDTAGPRPCPGGRPGVGTGRRALGAAVRRHRR